MLATLFFIIAMLFLFGITIFVHEWGHFFVARKLGLVAETFSIGMGPALWKKEINGVVYKIGAFPIGGYVSLPQLDPVGMDKIQGQNGEDGRPPLPEVSPWKKIAVAAAGPVCNILFAIPLAALVMLGASPPSNTAVGWVSTNSVAYAKGLRPSDVILKVNDTEVVDWYGIVSEDVLTKDAGTVDLTYLSGTGTNTITLDSESTRMESGIMMDAWLPLVLETTKGDAAEMAGIQAGDLITALNGKPIQWWHELSSSIQEYGEQEISITVKRDDELITMNVTPKTTKLEHPETKEEYEKVLIGIKPGDPGMLPWTMEGNPFEQIKSDGSKIFRLLQALSNKDERGSAAAALGGPVSIFAMLWFSLKLGFLYAIGLVRFININLAVLNLLPLPVLDGGHICFALWEGITKRKVHPKIVATLVNVFAILLITAMLFLTWRDSDRYWNVSKFFKNDKPAAEQVEESPTAD